MTDDWLKEIVMALHLPFHGLRAIYPIEHKGAFLMEASLM
jgi:hypothetical protein